MTTTTLLLLAAAVCSASFTISTTTMFLEVREFVSTVHHKFEELIHCPWCLSHWITFLFLFLTREWINFTGFIVIDFLLTTFAITGISGIGHFVLLRAYEPVTRYLVHRQIEKMKRENITNDTEQTDN